MITADLYIRVSTDEQAEKGDSQRDQDESGAKGKSKTYYYYHCHYKCGFRFDSDKLNELFELEISKLEYKPIIKDLMKEILLDNYKQFTYDIEAKRKSISKEINLLNEKIRGDLLTKRTIGCLIFPQKAEFDGKSFQTPKMNIVAQCIYQYNSGLGNKKNRHKRVKTSNVGLVTSTGFKPVTS